MTVISMKVRGPKGQFQPSLFLPDGMAEALADVMQRAAPTGRRKYVERQLRMDGDAARRVAEGRASKAQLDHAFKVGGWPLVLDVFEKLLGERVDQHFAREARRHAEIAQDYRSFARSRTGDGPAEDDQPDWGSGGSHGRMGGSKTG